MASVSFALAAGNTNPQDLADPDGTLRALSAAAASAVDDVLTVAADAWEMPVAAWQAVALETRRADSTLAYGGVLPVFATRLWGTAGTRPDRGVELVAVVRKGYVPERVSRDVLAELAAESRLGWQSDADRLFTEFDLSSSFDAPT
jgi:hypothetical protein